MDRLTGLSGSSIAVLKDEIRSKLVYFFKRRASKSGSTVGRIRRNAGRQKVIQLGNVKLNPSVKFLGVSRKVFTRGPGLKLIQSKIKGLQYGNGRVVWGSGRVIRSSM